MSSSLPATMKVVHQPDPKSIRLVLEDGPLPVPQSPGECLVRVYAASPCLNELHWEDWFPSLFEPGGEKVPCTEAAGVIVQAPLQAASDTPHERSFKEGDEVLFRLDVGMAGNLRQYTIARASQLAHKPRNVSWAVAAATPLSSLTAWQGVFDQSILDPKGIFGDVEARQKNSKLRILVTGASGVVGGWAVQFAALAGAGEVIANAAGANADYVKALGATQVVDYKKTDLADWVAENPESRQVDAILDCVGGATLSSCWHAIKHGGVLLSVSVDPVPVKPEGLEKDLAAAKWFLVKPIGSQLEIIAKLLGEGKCTTRVDSEVDFDNFQAAFDKVEEKRANGKVVINVAKL
ncbi:hypothetical protein NQ176_g1231 [Zarea fungicola]|uniref:Uncharacterized protein n=1 Tax=Zarea fungicola TaxID=93591 RepID=A0ACC1NUR1_9HYPO|nr:hypothetical protein NQ176_g1231 [Lecanicillium fungicola]